MDGFSLSKAYLDVVDPAGRCAILYRADLAWGPIELRWDGLSLFDPDRPAAHRSAWNRPDGVGARVSRRPWCAPFSTRLLDTPAGTLDWSCDAAGSDVVVETADGIAVRGAGYAEHLELGMLPWRLPIDELRWGRWHCAATRRSVVWIEWRGEHQLTLVLENGMKQDSATIGDAWIRWGDRSLGLASAETLYSRTLADILHGAGPLVRRLPARWRALEDRKTLSTGVLGDELGWAIQELVRFP